MERCPIDDYGTCVKLPIGTMMDEIEREVREEEQFEFGEKSYSNEHFFGIFDNQGFDAKSKGNNF